MKWGDGAPSSDMSVIGRLHDILQRPSSRFLSQAECTALAQRAAHFAVGGGETGIEIESTWTGNLRYARNTVTTSGDMRNNSVWVKRDIQGAAAGMLCNQIDDTGLQAAVRRAERVLRMQSERGDTRFQEHFVEPPKEQFQNLQEVKQFIADEDRVAALQSLIQTEESYSHPHIFFDTTYGLDATHRAAAVLPLIESVKHAGMVAAGYIEVSAHGRAVIDTWGRSLYYPYTKAQYSVTVRDPKGIGSGWAGVDWSDWARIDAQQLSDIALEKCLSSRNPVAIEPGRYTVILEPQAVCDLCANMVIWMDRNGAEGGLGPFSGNENGWSKIGQRVIDERISVSADPMDPDLGFPPFSENGNVYHPVTWIERGVLKELAYYRPFAIEKLGKNSGLPNSFAFRMSGGTKTIEDMIATTKRGLRVTRFSNVGVLDTKSLLSTGYTRDGLWLIENGKISKPVKNFRFTESPLFILNNVEQMGVPQRVFHPEAPVIVPPIKAHDFSFTSLSEAI
jgi:predicted Zn-dependent protease